MVPAAVAASDMASTFPKIKIGLLVGIGGALSRPQQKQDIRLGDVVVSQPDGVHGGVVQYDSGKAKSNQSWERTGHLNKPPIVLLNALTDASHGGLKGAGPPQEMVNPEDYDDDNPGFIHQGIENDRLFETSALHVDGGNCENCGTSFVARRKRVSTNPRFHYGVIASGNTLVKDAVAREGIADIVGGDCLCFEMEAAGLMDKFPCQVIRGISDYADSHKNDRWQPYAAATAAAFAKELLDYVQPTALDHTENVVDVLNSSQFIEK
ncbi:hypothetical protein IL306_012764 [Fusarium sp. DS 682]|nr:hypothetical protein IL306_012764 [Fusarium sp. DS 682]